MANTQIWVNQGKDWLWNTAAPAHGTTLTYGLSSKAFASFTASDTYATRTEVTYWTTGAAQTQAAAISSNGSAPGSTITWNTGSHTDGPATVLCGLVMIPGSNLLLYVVDLVTLVNNNLGTAYSNLPMNTANQAITWLPSPLLQNVGGG
jgi:hypothetical protein